MNTRQQQTMDFLKQHRDIIQASTGAGFLLVSAFCLRKVYIVSSFLLRNYDKLNYSMPDLRLFIKNPGMQKLVTLDRLSCIASPQIFKDHMSYIDRKDIGSVKQFCFKQPTASFMGEIASNEQKYEVYCDCSTYDPFVASPLLVNNYDLLKKIGKKQKLTMISYGNLRYDKDKRRFNFEGHCFGTSKEQIEWVWRNIFRKNISIMLVLGLLTGVGVRLCLQNYEKVLPMQQISEFLSSLMANSKEK